MAGARNGDEMRKFPELVDVLPFDDLGDRVGSRDEEQVGISTQKLHARGPMGLPELTSTKWIVRGTGQVRS